MEKRKKNSFKKRGGWKECTKVTIFGFDVVEEKERRKKRNMLSGVDRGFFCRRGYRYDSDGSIFFCSPESLSYYSMRKITS